MTKPKVPKASRKPVKRATKRREEVAVTTATETIETREFTEDEMSFPAKAPVGTIYRPTGATSSWIKRDEVSWEEVGDE